MKRNRMLRLAAYLLQSPFSLLFALLSAVLSVTATLAAPAVIGRAIDRMAGAHRVDFPAVLQAAAALAAIYLCSNFFLWLLSFLTNRVSYKTVHRLRRELFDKINRLPLRFFDNHPHGDTISRFVNDADIISDGMLQGVTVILSGLVTVVGSVVFMLRMNAGMTLVVVLAAPGAYFVARFITTRSQKLFREQARYLGRLNGYAEEIIHGHKAVKAFCHETQAMENFRSINDGLNRTGFESQFISSLSNPSTRIVVNISYALIGIIGGVLAIKGSITVGEISSFLIYSTIFTRPFNDITNILSLFQSADASAQRIFELLDLEPEKPDGAQAEELTDCEGHVRFDGVRFSYAPGKPLIEDFDLDVPAGSHIAIVGHTGAGKTTLVNLLMRFYDIDAGAITVDGRDIRRTRRDSLRRNFGMVLQDTWLFDGTIRENIAYAQPDAPIEAVVAAAKAAEADGFIRRLPHGYDTAVDADGGTLSRGQIQLITIARVMLAAPPMVILDEATSSIDTGTEMHVQHAFDRMMRGRTSFVIAHRLSTVKNADRILVMDHGKIAESGTHAELLRQDGVYASLYRSQFAGADLADEG